ncbi:MAG: molecular chaperone HtpG [Bacteroidaceae bacterium]|nr:molecular chaperone HtpG [Bacteroidaceae bacterium]
MQKGTIGVTTDNIFPIIKQFLYSDHEIFLREIVSNAVDATQKLRILSQRGEVKGELGDLTIHVNVDKDKGTITISDRGIGMTEEEINKYINQIAFSGANEFLEKYKKDDAASIIGHFGLGFYSAFMVSKQVDIVTRSYKEDAKAMKWTCDGTPEFQMEETEKEGRGTDIILYIDDDCKEYLEKYKILELLRKYCKFLPVPVACGKKTEWKDGKEVDTDEDNIINNVNPLWKQKTTELKDEHYKKFYQELYPGNDEPMFWIHLNVDYPFNLTGVLYFPKIKNNIELQHNKIQLYCNQVFVTDQVENIVPEFLTLLHGVIDSPDIPLNVSRSYLQSDANVKKISNYIMKKVSDRLQSQFKDNRKEFEEKWDDLKLFIHYGMLSQPNFYDKAKDYALLKDTEGKYYTYEEYKKLIEGNQTDKNKNLIYLYSNNVEEQYSFVETAKEKGYSVLLLDGQLDVPMVGLLEEKLGQCRFSRVDADIVERLIQKEDELKTNLSDEQTQQLSTIFKSQLPSLSGKDFHVEAQALGENSNPVMITQNEFSRRMKEMSRIQQGMSFYGQMPDMYAVVLNADHPLIKKVLDDATQKTEAALKPILAELKGLHARQSVLRQQQNDKKPEEITQEMKDDLETCNKSIREEETKRDNIISSYAKDNDIVHQLIDLALLQNGLLKGDALNQFLKRSINLIH